MWPFHRNRTSERDITRALHAHGLAAHVESIRLNNNRLTVILHASADMADALTRDCHTALAPLKLDKIDVIVTEHSSVEGRPAAPQNMPSQAKQVNPNLSTATAGARSEGGSGGGPVGVAHEHKQTAPPRQNIPHVTRIIAIAAGKGGVGKSTVTTLLAHALGARGHRVAICDCDIYGPSIPRMLGLPLTQPVLRDGKMIPHHNHGIAANSIGFIMGDSAAILRGPMVSKSLKQLLFLTEWRESHQTEEEAPLLSTATAGAQSEEALRALHASLSASPKATGRRDAPHKEPLTLLLDLPPGTGDVQLSLAQSLNIDGAILVTTPQEIAVMDARKAAAMFAKTGVPVLGVIENMSGFTDAQGNMHALFGVGGGGSLAADIGAPLLAQLPLDPAIGLAMDRGSAPPADSPTLQAMVQVAARITTS